MFKRQCCVGPEHGAMPHSCPGRGTLPAHPCSQLRPCQSLSPWGGPCDSQPPEHRPTALLVPHSLCQEQLPATGVPITRQRFDQMRSMFNEYVRSSTLQNWKFWIVSFGASACCLL